MKDIKQVFSFIMKLLRDPIWQSVGVLLAVATIFVATTSSTSNGELAVIHTQNIKFADYLLPSNVIKLQLPKSGEGIDNAIIEYYLVINKSDKPILPKDYISALTVDQSVANKKILLVDSCAPPPAQQSSAASCKVGSFVPTTWENKGTKWLAAPTLLNSHENFCVIVLTQSTNQENEFENMSTQWDGRIVGTQIKTYASEEKYYKSLERRWTDYLLTEIHMEGYGAYWFALLQVTAFYATAMLARQAKWLIFRAPIRFGRMILIMLMSTSTAEILVDIFVNQRGIGQLSVVVWPLLMAHAALITYLLFHSLKIRFAR